MPYHSKPAGVPVVLGTIMLAALLLVVAAPLAVLAQEPAAEPPAPAQEAPELPPGEQLVDLFVETTGEANASADIETIVQRGTMELVGMGIGGKIVISMARPDKTLTRFEAAALGTVTSGAAGGVAWELSDIQGPRLITGSERDFLERSSQIDGFARWREFYTSAETVGVEEVDGSTCYVVEMTPVSGSTERWFLDTESKLLVRMKLTATTAMGDIPMEMDFEEYLRDPKGIMRPWRSSQKVLGQHMQVVIESVEYDIELDPSMFEPPPQVQALLDQEQSAPEEPEQQEEPAEDEG